MCLSVLCLQLIVHVVLFYIRFVCSNNKPRSCESLNTSLTFTLRVCHYYSVVSVMLCSPKVLIGSIKLIVKRLKGDQLVKR